MSFRMCSLLEEEAEECVVLASSFSLSASWLPRDEQLLSAMTFLPSHQLESHGARWPWTETLGTLSPNQPSFFVMFSSQMFYHNNRKLMNAGLSPWENEGLGVMAAFWGPRESQFHVQNI